ncbi:MAG: carbohydrate-binding domain-containing protein [Defluviitaleaceae bacterium]|nr:carbohydrate-binding domain-containing protein [Defluviitaleaceae bacterium]
MKNIKNLILAAVGGFAVLASCANAANPLDEPLANVAEVAEVVEVAEVAEITTIVTAETPTAAIQPVATVAEPQAASTIITLSGDNAQINGNGAEFIRINASEGVFSSGILTINTAGTYVLTGELTGQILVDAADEVVRLILDGVNIHNENGLAIFAPRAAQLEITILGENTVSDGTNHPDDNANATIYIQPNLRIDGEGVLTVRSGFRHGLRSQGVLTIYGGVFDIATTDGNALQGRDGVIIHGGDFDLVGGGEGDGIRASRENDPERGFITINGGNFTITAGDDGLQAETTIEINGGNFTITAVDDGMTTSGSVIVTDGVIHILDSYEGIEGLNITILGGNITIFARDDAINARDSNEPTGGTRGRYGINPEMFVRIAGGHVVLHALNDGIDSNGNTFLEGGLLQITAPSHGFGADAIEQDGIFTVTGGELITAGTVRSVYAGSTQPVLMVTFPQRLAAGTLVELRDFGGNLLLSHVAENSFPASAFSSSVFEIGESYLLYVDGERISEVLLGSVFMRVNVGNVGNAGNRAAPPRGRGR